MRPDLGNFYQGNFLECIEWIVIKWYYVSEYLKSVWNLEWFDISMEFNCSVVDIKA